MKDRESKNPLRHVVLGLAVAAGAAGFTGLTHSATRSASAAPPAPGTPATPVKSASSGGTPTRATPVAPLAPAAPVAPSIPDAPVSSELGQEQGVTKPSEESSLAFPGPGVISKVLVKPGDTVKTGDVVASQDDRVEVAQLAAAQAEATTLDTEIQAYIAQADLAKVKLKRTEALYADLLKQGSTNTEIDEARVEVRVADIRVELTRKQKKEKDLATALQQVKVDQKKLVSPVDGVVAMVDVHPGEGTDLTKSVLQVVKNDPLWVEVDVNSSKAKMLSQNQTLKVRYRDENDWMQAQIIFLTPYADAGSDTRKVRLQMPNPKHREAGLPVVVQLPENIASAK